MELSQKEIKHLMGRQRNEITEYHIYMNVAKSFPENSKNYEIIKSIAESEKRHSEIWEKYTKVKMKPNWLKVYLISLCAKVIGVTFTLKMMESGERDAQTSYAAISSSPEAIEIMKEEQEHERQLLSLMEEKRLDYIGSIVLGLNDALVELTGALAGLTLALQSTKAMGSIALITGLAAAMAMSVAQYLSTKHEKTDRSPILSALSTGLAYVVAVILITLPYFFIENAFVALFVMIAVVIIIVAAFTFYTAVAQDKKFLSIFLEMVIITIVVAIISFGIGALIGKVFNLNMI